MELVWWHIPIGVAMIFILSHIIADPEFPVPQKSGAYIVIGLICILYLVIAVF